MNRPLETRSPSHLQQLAAGPDVNARFWQIKNYPVHYMKQFHAGPRPSGAVYPRPLQKWNRPCWTRIMRFSEPQRMCEQLLLFAVFNLFCSCSDFACFSCFFHVFFLHFFLNVAAFLQFVGFCQCFLFHCAFLVFACFVFASSLSLSSSRIGITWGKN